MDIGIRELKQRLSALVERASRGEAIRVTDRGRPKAILGPLPGRLRLEAGIAEGWIRTGASAAPRPVRRHRARRASEDDLAEDRGS